MTRAIVLMSLGALLALGPVAQADEVTVATAPPVVIRTVPEAGDLSVGAGTREIKVTFSKTMLPGSWSFVQLSKETFPASTGAPTYDKDERTCVLPVHLEPGRTYAIWFNSGDKYNKFQDSDHRPAIPYLLVFKTKLQ